jgi:2-keto-4-pentenoate hydratase/2-oxohepta-3-ene-1,7-dioic acid hydratase in catechol pathway
MRIASYRTSKGAGYGIVIEDGIVDLTRRIGGKYPDLRALIAGGALAQGEKIAKGAKKTDLKLAKVSFLPVIANPGKIICVGLNYEEHRMETGRDKTENPALFIRVPESQVGHNQPILLPPESTHLDYEGEIAVIVGKPGRRISRENSWKHIAGYACYNDGSVRDWQRHTLQWTAGKNFSRTGGFGPWMTTRGEIKDGEELTLETRLNGQVMQHATTGQMIHRIPRLINYISTFTSLEPGDVIVTGTPGGVGARRNPPLWMKTGDKVEVEVTKIGVLVNTIKAERAVRTAAIPQSGLEARLPAGVA